MIEPVVFASVEVALADYLTAALADRDIEGPVVNGVPDRTRLTRYVLIVRIGGAVSNLITDTPRIVAECVDQYGTAAAELAVIVRALIGAAAPGYIGGIWVDKVRDLGMIFSPDPDTNLPRYVITTELHAKGAAMT